MAKPNRSIDREKVFSLIRRYWPTHVTEVAHQMGLLAKHSSPQEKKAVLAHLKYHFDQLAREDRIKVKKIGQALVAWPSSMEQMRMIHEMMSE